jgi:hypothetical protein
MPHPAQKKRRMEHCEFSKNSELRTNSLGGALRLSATDFAIVSLRSLHIHLPTPAKEIDGLQNHEVNEVPSDMRTLESCEHDRCSASESRLEEIHLGLCSFDQKGICTGCFYRSFGLREQKILVVRGC